MLPASSRRNPAPNLFIMTHLDYHNKGFDDLPLFTGEVLRDEGIAKVSENNERWMEMCIETATGFVPMYGNFTGEDLRFYLGRVVGCPTHSNAWGALISTLVRRKIIKPTGEWRKMRDDSSHARKTPVYTK